jgi:hypothetical protein
VALFPQSGVKLNGPFSLQRGQHSAELLASQEQLQRKKERERREGREKGRKEGRKEYREIFL